MVAFLQLRSSPLPTQGTKTKNNLEFSQTLFFEYEYTLRNQYLEHLGICYHVYLHSCEAWKLFQRRFNLIFNGWLFQKKGRESDVPCCSPHKETLKIDYLKTCLFVWECLQYLAVAPKFGCKFATVGIPRLSSSKHYSSRRPSTQVKHQRNIEHRL